MTTLQEIAALTGVSKSTVSKALRNTGEINAETVARIRSAALSLGYDTERLRGETPGRKTIGVIFPELRSLYYNKIYDRFCAEMNGAGYRVISMLYNFADFNRQLDDVAFMLDQNAAGILYLTENTFDLARLRAMFEMTQTRLVMITLNPEIGFCDTISNNHALGVRLAVEHLYGLGHRRIAFIGETHTYLRRDEFIASMKHFGLDVPPEYIVEGSERFENCGYNGMKQLLSLPRPMLPTACFTAYDNIAYGAMHAVREAGLRIPEDISVIGVDDNNISKYTDPPLTSINSPEGEIGRTAAEFMKERIGGSRKPFRNILICPSLIRRESTGERKETQSD